jgi:hypothetical protein
MTNLMRTLGDRLLDRLVPSWQAKADTCVVDHNVNEGACWVSYQECNTSKGAVYCKYNDCNGHEFKYSGPC